MAYEPTVWNCDDDISAEKLNKLEEGVAQIMSDYVPTQWSCDDTITAEKLNKLEQAVAEASEGGSSDFSTATVTVVNTNTVSGVSMTGANTLDDGEDTGSAGGMGVSLGATQTFNVILYKGVAWVNAVDATIVSVVGSAERLGSSTAMVTGDCTITLS